MPPSLERKAGGARRLRRTAHIGQLMKGVGPTFVRALFTQRVSVVCGRRRRTGQPVGCGIALGLLDSAENHRRGPSPPPVFGDGRHLFGEP
jgi:hypothetical protein